MTFLELTEDSRGESHDVVAQPISEQDLVKALTEQAHKIATTVLTRPGTGEDLIYDAQVRIFYREKFNKQFLGPIVSIFHVLITISAFPSTCPN